MYIYIYVYIHTYIYAYIYGEREIYTSLSLSIYIYIIRTCKHVIIHSYIVIIIVTIQILHKAPEPALAAGAPDMLEMSGLPGARAGLNGDVYIYIYIYMYMYT